MGRSYGEAIFPIKTAVLWQMTGLDTLKAMPRRNQYTIFWMTHYPIERYTKI